MSRDGRVTIPKAFRDKLGLRAGDQIETEVQGDWLSMRPVRESPALVKKHGIWVCYAEATTEIDDAALLERVREDRIEHFAPRRISQAGS